MHPDCEASLAAFLGRNLKPTEARDAEDLIKLHSRLLAQKDPQAWLKMGPYERLNNAARSAAQAMVADLKKKQQRVALQIAAHDRIEAQLAAANANLPPAKEHFWQFGRTKPGTRLRVVSDLLAFDAVPHGIQSAETASHAIAWEALGQLKDLWASVKGVGHFFENRQGVRDLIHELFGESSGNAAARAAAQAWMRVTDGLRDRANAAGADIGQLDENEYHYPQSHSPGRIAQAGPEKWANDTLPLLKRERYLNEDGTRMTDEQLRAGLLPTAYDSITMEGLNKSEPGKSAPPGMGASIAARGSQHRALFFKDADSYLTYQGLYGERSIWPTLTGHVFGIARDIGLMETLGPNPDQTFRYFNDRTLQEEARANPAMTDKLRSQAHYNESLMDTVAGRRSAVNNKVAEAAQAFRNFETATKLGSVVFTAMGDEAGMAATAFANKVPWSEVFAREFRYLNPANVEDRDIAARAGLGINSMIGGLNRFSTEDMQLGGGRGTTAAARDFTSKMATGVLNASGAEAMWDARRRGLGSILMSYLGKTVAGVEHFKDLSVDDHGMLASKGITENDWQVWKRAQLEDWGMRHGVLTPKSVWAIPDEALRSLGDPTALKRHASTALLGHVLEETGMGVMETGARERTSMLFGTKPGTLAGELTRTAFLFKSFAFSMMLKHWARAAALPSGSATAAYAARILVTGTVMGALATELRNLSSGKDPANVAEPRFWGEAFLRGGGLGVFGDFLYDSMSSRGTTPTEILGGPGASTFADLYNLSWGAYMKHEHGERTDEAANLIRFARDNNPLNLWYTKAAFDHLVWNEMQEVASPGYLERMQAKAYANRGTTYWWDPGSATPQQAPDLAKAWQPDLGRDQLNRIAQATGMGAD